MLSPAAYLCDLLLWLRNHPLPGPNPNALAALDARRPDIRHLLLNCPNSETPLPYIDLVNELLADAISPPVDPNSTINPPWKQTTVTKTAAELRAAPEYLQPAGVRDPLRSGLSAHSSLQRRARRAAHLPAAVQCPSGQLRDGLLPLHAPTVAQRAAAAAERFGMAPARSRPGHHANFVTTRAAWNIPAAQDPLTVLAPIPAFLQAASINYESLLELLECPGSGRHRGSRIAGRRRHLRHQYPEPLACAARRRPARPRPPLPARCGGAPGSRCGSSTCCFAPPAVANGTLDQNALAALLRLPAAAGRDPAGRRCSSSRSSRISIPRRTAIPTARRRPRSTRASSSTRR